MTKGFINAEGVHQRRMQVPDRTAQFTWLGNEDPSKEFLEAMQALVDAVTDEEMKRRERESE